MNILVVDDVGFSRYRICQVLGQAGHATKSAASGAEALQILRLDTQIDVVITDDAMPQMDGIQLFHESRKIERLDDSGNHQSPAFILMAMPASNSASGRGAQFTAKNAQDLGFAAVLTRPVCFRTLEGYLKVIARARNRVDAPARSSGSSEVDGLRSPAPCDAAPQPALSALEAAVARVSQSGDRRGANRDAESPGLREIAGELRRFADTLDPRSRPV